MSDRPNVLWVCTDQQRYDTVCELGNHRIRTPHVDALVASGVAFTRAFAQSPVCAPSRASFLTGRYPRTTRCRQNGQSLPDDERLVTRILADHDYTCGLAGKLHLASASEGKVERRVDDGYAAQHFHWSHHPQDDWGQANAYTRWLDQRGVRYNDLFGGPARLPDVNYASTVPGQGAPPHDAGHASNSSGQTVSPHVFYGIPAQFHQTTWCGEVAVDFIHQMAGRGPWLFSFNCFDPHHPFDPPREYLERYDLRNIPLPTYKPGELQRKTVWQRIDHRQSRDGFAQYDFQRMSEADMRLITAAYYAMIELVDDQVGRMLAALEETGQRDNTLIIYMSDHGELLGDHGVYLKGPHFYDPSVRVPLVLSLPGRFARGVRADALVELVDLAPTLLEAAGVAVPPAMQGRSLLPILAGRTSPSYHRGHVFAEYYNAWQHRHAYGSMLRTSNAKIAVYHGTNAGELYDLENDPDEFENLWESVEHAELKMQMLKSCFDASVFTMDPTPLRGGAF